MALEDYDFDLRTCPAHRCPGPWSYFYAPALGRDSLLAPRESSTLAAARIELPLYDPAGVFFRRRNLIPRSKRRRPRAPLVAAPRATAARFPFSSLKLTHFLFD